MTAVMNLDILASMVIYTVATFAFYLLGAGILHTQGLVPAAKDMIPVLSKMYTETLGPSAVWLFYAGAIATLYGLIFSRQPPLTPVSMPIWPGCTRLFPEGDYAARCRWRNGTVVALVWVLTITLYFFWQSPVLMVKLGGMAQASMLPVILPLAPCFCASSECLTR